MSLSKLGQAALSYAEQLDLFLLPLWGVKDGVCLCRRARACPDAGKHPIGPLVKHGKDDASNDPDVIRRWWGRYPDANIGVACGPSKLLVVDIDPRNGGRETWEQLVERHGLPPDTAEAETGGGGSHLLFRRPPVFHAKDSKLGPGIDIKAGGYIVVAPSNHKARREYVWLADSDPLDGTAIADPPSWLTDRLTTKEEKSSAHAPVERFRYREGAQPPPEFWEAIKSDTALAGIWERTRHPASQRDDTPSAWTMSLRRRLLKFRLDPQAALDTMVSYRRKHGDRRKGKPWFLAETTQYAADLEKPGSRPRDGSPPPSLRRNPSPVDRTRDAIEQALRHGEELPRRAISERLLLIHLAGYSKDGEFAWPSHKRLAQTTGLSIDHVSDRMRRLERHGCIKKVGRSGPGTTNRYRLEFTDTPHEHTG